MRKMLMVIAREEQTQGVVDRLANVSRPTLVGQNECRFAG
jgi:hypothetical protein